MALQTDNSVPGSKGLRDCSRLAGTQRLQLQKHIHADIQVTRAADQVEPGLAFRVQVVTTRKVQNPRLDIEAYRDRNRNLDWADRDRQISRFVSAKVKVDNISKERLFIFPCRKRAHESHLEVIEQVTEREFDLGPTNRLSAHVRTPQVDRTRELPLILSCLRIRTGPVPG